MLPVALESDPLRLNPPVRNTALALQVATDKLDELAGRLAITSGQIGQSTDEISVDAHTAGDVFALKPEGEFTKENYFIRRGIESYLLAASRLYHRAEAWVALGAHENPIDSREQILDMCQRVAEWFGMFSEGVTAAYAGAGMLLGKSVEGDLEKLRMIIVSLEVRFASSPQFSIYIGGPIAIGDVFTRTLCKSEQGERIMILAIGDEAVTLARLGETGGFRREVIPAAGAQALLVGSVREWRKCPVLHPSSAVFVEREPEFGFGSDTIEPGALLCSSDALRPLELQGVQEILTVNTTGPDAFAVVLEGQGTDSQWTEFSVTEVPLPLAAGYTAQVVRVHTYWSWLNDLPTKAASQFNQATFQRLLHTALDPKWVPFRPGDLIVQGQGIYPRLVLATHPLGVQCLAGDTAGFGGGSFMYLTNDAACGWCTEKRASQADLADVFSRVPLREVILSEITSSRAGPVRNTRLRWDLVPAGAHLCYPDRYEVILTKQAGLGVVYVSSLSVEADGTLKLCRGLRTNAEFSRPSSLTRFLFPPSLADHIVHRKGMAEIGEVPIGGPTRDQLLQITGDADSPFMVYILGSNSRGSGEDLFAELNRCSATFVYADTAGQAEVQTPIGTPASLQLPIRISGMKSGTVAGLEVAPPREPPHTPRQVCATLAIPDSEAKKLTPEVRHEAVSAVSALISKTCADRGVSSIAVFLGSGCEVWRDLRRWLGCAVDTKSFREDLAPLGDIILCEGTSSELDLAIRIIRSRGTDHPKIHIVRNKSELNLALVTIGAIQGHPSQLNEFNFDILRRFASPGEHPTYFDSLNLSRSARELRELTSLIHDEVCAFVHSACCRLASRGNEAVERYLTVVNPHLSSLTQHSRDFIRVSDRATTFCEREIDLLSFSPDPIDDAPLSRLERIFAAVDRRVARLGEAARGYGRARALPSPFWEAKLKAANVHDQIAQTRMCAGQLHRDYEDIAARTAQFLSEYAIADDTILPTAKKLHHIPPGFFSFITHLTMSSFGDPNKPEQVEKGVTVGRYTPDRFRADSASLRFFVAEGAGRRLDAAIICSRPGCVESFVPPEILAAVKDLGQPVYVDMMIKRPGAPVTALLEVIDLFMLSMRGEAGVLLTSINVNNVRSGQFSGSRFNLTLLPGAREEVVTVNGGVTTFAWYYCTFDKAPSGAAGSRSAYVARMAADGILPATYSATFATEMEMGARIRAAFHRIPTSFISNLSVKWKEFTDRMALLYKNSVAIVEALEKGTKIPDPEPLSPNANE